VKNRVPLKGKIKNCFFPPVWTSLIFENQITAKVGEAVRRVNELTERKAGFRDGAHWELQTTVFCWGSVAFRAKVSSSTGLWKPHSVTRRAVSYAAFGLYCRLSIRQRFLSSKLLTNLVVVGYLKSVANSVAFLTSLTSQSTQTYRFSEQKDKQFALSRENIHVTHTVHVLTFTIPTRKYT
jgi:hypothetical protein